MNDMSDRMVIVLGIVSIIALLALRVYAMCFTVYVTTPWDDTHYRWTATNEASTTTLANAARGVFAPHPIIRQGRYGNYHAWLVLGKKLFKASRPDFEFQLINFILLLIQGVALFLLCRWAIKKISFGLTITFLWLSSPIVFGTNRWVLTENLVLTGLLVLPLAASWLLTVDYNKVKEKKFFSAGEIAIAATAVYIIGVFGTSREYVVCSTMVTYICVVLGLSLEKRYAAAVSSVVIFAPFCWTLVTPLTLMFWNACSKNGKFYLTAWFHPMNEWIPHVFVYVVGPAVSIVLAAGIVMLIRLGYKKIKEFYMKCGHDETIKLITFKAAQFLPVFFGFYAILFLFLFGLAKNMDSLIHIPIIFRILLFLLLLVQPLILCYVMHLINKFVICKFTADINNVKGIHILYIGYVFLACMYLALIVISKIRGARLAIPSMATLLIVVLFAAKIFPFVQSRLKTAVAKMAVVLIFLSWAVLLHQLFIMFEGGKAYKHHATNLEYINHPLFLRQLRNPLDSHIY